MALAGLGGVAAAIGQAAFAITCLATAEQLVKTIDYYFESTDRIDYERNLAIARGQVSEVEYEAAVRAKVADYEQVAREVLNL